MTREQTRQSDDTPGTRSRYSNLFVRAVTGMVLLPVIVGLIILGGWPFALMVGILVGIGTLEFYFMEKRRGLQNNVAIGLIASTLVLVSFFINDPRLWQIALALSALLTFTIEYARSRALSDSLMRVATTLGGLFYIAFPGAFLLAMRSSAPMGIHWVFVVIFCTWSVDTFSYIFGNIFGKTKLAPTLSPNKTREGAIAGLIFGTVLPLLVLLRGQIFEWRVIPLLLLAPVIAILGDLFESGMKRYFGVKDSGVQGFNPFPGHGGVLDRIDSLLWVSTGVYVYLLIVGKVPILF
jgi:phosphatidate cytidylyltransferase